MVPAISSLYIYSEPRCQAIDFQEVAAYAASILKSTRVILRGPLMEDSIDGNGPLGRRIPPGEIAQLMAAAKVKRANAPSSGAQKVFPGELDYEMRRLADRASDVFGILYDAYAFALMYAGLIPAQESRIDCLHLIFTNQLMGTWDEGDRRYHARSVLLSAPSVVSVSGLVEAPAKERAYYVAKRSAEVIGCPEEKKKDMSREFAGDCLSHDDARLTEVSKGFVMQAAAYWMSGIPFCDDPGCRLFNAHWQSELLGSQLDGAYEFCGEHRQTFEQAGVRSEGTWT